jgi:hypothetical protein
MTRSLRRRIEWSAALVGVLAVPAVWGAVARHRDSTCRNLQMVANFAGSSEEFDRLAAGGSLDGCVLESLDGYRSHLLLGVPFAIAYGALLFFVCTRWWDRAWLTRRFVAAKPVRWFALVAAACDLVSIAVQWLSVDVDEGGSVSVGTWPARVLAVVSWVKVFSFTAVWFAALTTLIAVFSRRRLTELNKEACTPYADAPIDGLGIALSGGGIRAASVGLGALGVLERFPLVDQPPRDEPRRPAGFQGLLYRAKYLASVSGGGYVVGGWRAASAIGATRLDSGELDEDAFGAMWPDDVVGHPLLYDEAPPLAADSDGGDGYPTLFRHVQQRREFLRTGRGGLPASVVVAFVFLAFHLLLITTLVVVVAWPAGRLASTWFVFGSEAASIVDSEGRQAPFPARLYMPALCFAISAGVVFGLCLFQWNTTRRRQMMAIGWGLTAAAATTGVVLIAVPWMLDVVYPFLVEHANVRAIVGLASAGGVIGLAIAVAKRVLRPRLVYLGGLVLAVGVASVAILVAGQAASGHGFFTLSAVDWWRGTPSWTTLVATLVLAYFLLCPRWWSLHTLYRNRLRLAFIASRDPGLAPWGIRFTRRRKRSKDWMWPIRKSAEPLLPTYQDAPGPQHLVCCAAARTNVRATGVKALSFVIDPIHVELHDIGYHRDRLLTTTYRADTGQWVQALGASTARQAEGTLSAAISVSGAAVAPAMGRMDLRSTNALIAALNLRLGTWLPNPRYVPDTGQRVRFPWVRLSYLLKEITGYFDLADHHVYVTDGGHRENLGLVELLRRRCKTIICIDSSGDTPGEFTTLRQAAAMARIEVGAHIDLTALPASISPQPEFAHTVLPVVYRNSDEVEVGTGTIIHIAALMFQQAPDDLIAYGLEDLRFPHYSTGDQFLTEEQYRRLVLFGRAATRTALNQPNVRKSIDEALPDCAQ